MSYLPTTLTPIKQRAALALVENDFAGKDRLSQEQLADKLGLSRQTLYNYRNDPDFIAYMQSLSDKKLGEARAKVDAKLLDMIDKNSIRAIQLYYQQQGLLVNKSEVTRYDGNKTQLTQEQITEGIDDLARKLREGGQGE